MIEGERYSTFFFCSGQSRTIGEARYYETGQVLIDAMTEQSLYSVWLKDTRYYSIELIQDLFGNWIVKCSWGRHKTNGAGRSKSTVCGNYEQALPAYRKEQTRRVKRGYTLQN